MTIGPGPRVAGACSTTGVNRSPGLAKHSWENNVLTGSEILLGIGVLPPVVGVEPERIILASGGVGICYRSIVRITEAHSAPGAYAIWPLIGAMAIRSAMATFKFRAGRRIGSVSLMADAWNDAVDVLSAVAALVALGLTLSDPGRYLAADHYGGLAVGLFVIYTGLRVLREASMDLIDTMPPAGTIEAIRCAAAAVEEVCGTEKCYARKAGLKFHVELHLEVDPRMTVKDSHAVATQVRSHIRGALPSVGDVIVHIEPSRQPRRGRQLATN